jgi:hypothetical protein
MTVRDGLGPCCRFPLRALALGTQTATRVCAEAMQKVWRWCGDLPARASGCVSATRQRRRHVPSATRNRSARNYLLVGLSSGNPGGLSGERSPAPREAGVPGCPCRLARQVKGLLRAPQKPTGPRHGGQSPQESHGRSGTLRYLLYVLNHGEQPTSSIDAHELGCWSLSR